jgi:DNA polymerase III epsilon subunit-like protein
MWSLPQLLRKSQVAPDARLDELRYVVFDTEFTSLEQRSKRLLSIGALKMQGGSIRIGEQFYALTNPGVAVPGDSVVVHKLRAEDIAEAESPEQVLKRFVGFAAGAVLVGHFVSYDVDIVRKELAAFGCDWKQPAIDTAQVHRWLEMKRRHHPAEAFDERTIRTDLASVAAHYGVTFEEAHHALADAYVTAQVWQRELAELAKSGVRTWKELKPALR